MTVNYEDVLEATYRKLIKPGFRVFDIGAHSGRHTAVYSELVAAEGRVYAFEPLRDVFIWLQTRLLEADTENVVGFNLALGDKRGEMTFVRADGALEESGLRARKVYNQPDATTIRNVVVWCDTLDYLFADVTRLDYVKIDVEGAEIGVLEGGRKLISRTRPMISIEYGVPTYSSYGLTSDSLWNWCVREGYAVYDVYCRPVLDPGRLRYICEERGDIWDFWLVPEEQTELFERSTQEA